MNGKRRRCALISASFHIAYLIICATDCCSSGKRRKSGSYRRATHGKVDKRTRAKLRQYRSKMLFRELAIFYPPLSAEPLIRGDIIVVRIGDIVPADARILTGHLSNLQCDEALLTGESLPVQKTTDIITDPTCPVGDRTCKVFAGSQVVKVRSTLILSALLF